MYFLLTRNMCVCVGCALRPCALSFLDSRPHTMTNGCAALRPCALDCIQDLIVYVIHVITLALLTKSTGGTPDSGHRTR